MAFMKMLGFGFFTKKELTATEPTADDTLINELTKVVKDLELRHDWRRLSPFDILKLISPKFELRVRYDVLNGSFHFYIGYKVEQYKRYQILSRSKAELEVELISTPVNEKCINDICSATPSSILETMHNSEFEDLGFVRAANRLILNGGVPVKKKNYMVLPDQNHPNFKDLVEKAGLGGYYGRFVKESFLREDIPFHYFIPLGVNVLSEAILKEKELHDWFSAENGKILLYVFQDDAYEQRNCRTELLDRVDFTSIYANLDFSCIEQIIADKLALEVKNWFSETAVRIYWRGEGFVGRVLLEDNELVFLASCKPDGDEFYRRVIVDKDLRSIFIERKLPTKRGSIDILDKIIDYYLGSEFFLPVDFSDDDFAKVSFIKRG